MKATKATEARKHERKPYLGRVSVCPLRGEEPPFEVDGLDLSRGGLLMFSPRSLAVGRAVELRLPMPAGPGRPAERVLTGRVAFLRVEPAGNVLGIAFDRILAPDELAALMEGVSVEVASSGRRGHTILELMIVLIMTGVLASLSLPSFLRTMEQSRADLAAANLRSVWSAQRLYWLDQRSYAADLPTLQGVGLLDPAIVRGSPFYSYAVEVTGDSTFVVTATRAPGGGWGGSFSVDQDGTLAGALDSTDGTQIVPGS